MSNLGQIEDNILLKLPPEFANEFRAKIRRETLPNFRIIPDPNSVDQAGVIRLFKVELDGFPPMKGTLVDMPCIIEIQKSVEKMYYYKTGDISQQLVVQLADDDTPIQNKLDMANNPAELDNLRYQCDSGITPPAFGCRKRWVLERTVCECPDQINDTCSICGSMPKHKVQIASQKLYNLMIAKPTETFRIVDREVENTQSMVRSSSNLQTPASIARATPNVNQTPNPNKTPNINRTPSVKRTPVRTPNIAQQSPQSSEKSKITFSGSQTGSSKITFAVPKPKQPAKLIQKPLGTRPAVNANQQQIARYQEMQRKLAQKQEGLKRKINAPGIDDKEKEHLDEQYQKCIQHGFDLKKRIFDLQRLRIPKKY